MSFSTGSTPDFASGPAKQLLIDGRWADAASGDTFASINPTNGGTLPGLARGAAADVDRAVAAARRAFEGPWRTFRPADRRRVLLRLADLIEARSEELATIEALDFGAPLRLGRWLVANAADTFRFAAGMATMLHGDTIENSSPTPAFSYTRKEPVGVVGSIIPWNGPLFAAAYNNSGQVCAAGTRLYVERPVYEEFTERVAAVAASLRLGDPLLDDTDLGPLVSREQFDRVTGYLTAGREEGATARTGGSVPSDPALAGGFFVEPTLFTSVTDDMSIAREEIFGPVLSAIPFDDLQDAVSRANDTPYGLAGGVWTQDIDKALTVSEGLRAGMVFVNDYGFTDPAVPFGGYKMSGYGRENGRDSYDQYLQTKAVWIRRK
jgi:acyl-CoA reductase-like NAD-dependent aldehyde dehydrogenase